MWQVKRLVSIFVGLLCLCGCSLTKRIARTSARVEKMYEQTREWSALPRKSITWHQALSMMRAENLELAELNDAIERAERDSLSVYTEMIPGVSYYGFMSRTISELSAPMSSEDLASHVNVQFSLPMLTQVPFKVYAAKARTYAAIKRKEGKERELVSKLYQLVRQRQVEDAKRALMERAPEDEMRESSPQQLARRKQSDERYWQEVASILGRRDVCWFILPESMPKVRWEDYNPRLDRLGELVVCELALQLENARLSQYQIALRYLPTINTNLYSPSLFSSTGGTYGGTFLGGDDTRLSLNISYSLDTQLTSWNSYQYNKASYEREKVRVADRLVEHRNKVRTLRESMREYMSWRNYMLKHMAYLRQASPQSADELIERSKTLYNMELELLSQEASAIDSEAAVVLEYGMPDELGRTASRSGAKEQ